MWPRRSTAKSWPIFLTRNAMKEIKYLVCSLFLSLFSTRQDQPPLPVGGVAFQQQSHTIQNNSPSYRSATKVIVEGVGRWGCRRQRIGQRGFQFNFESHPNTFLETTAASQFSFFRCSINLGRYNMIFVETSAKDNTGVEQVPFDSTTESDLKMWPKYIWVAGFPRAGGPSVTKPRHLEPRPRTRQRCSFSGSASYFGVSKHLPKWFGSLSFSFQASTKKNLQSAALLWNLDRCILAVFIYFCIFPNNKIHKSDLRDAVFVSLVQIKVVFFQLQHVPLFYSSHDTSSKCNADICLGKGLWED